MLAGVLALIGWLLDAQVPTALMPGQVAMKANTDVSPIVLGGAPPGTSP
jgi:hypothetical protein